MPAITPERWTDLPRIAESADAPERPVVRLTTAPSLLEGAGFPVRRPFPSRDIGFREADPFLLLDHMGAVEYGPGEAKGAPWHPHRGFETVTYMIDGVMRHRDSQGGGGMITDGDTQWMTAGAGILHDEMPPEDLVAKGGLFHGIQLWVNLPRALKWTPPRYQSLEASHVTVVASARGDALVRIIAGEVGGFRGPGVTWTPITVIHASLEPGARLVLPWPQEFNAMAYVLTGSGDVGPNHVLIREGQGVLFGSGQSLRVTASQTPAGPTGRMEVLILGGQPIREPIASYGPFVMNTHAEIVQAFEDYQSGKMGQIPATDFRPS
ncbi:Pirin domain protein [Sulfobacillus acidophilus TPY]|uniref:Pirin domain protein n=1 Tax=Sulfobacillus acidophilus (strain ATCC 700253 / DSM 10332 / NAL) TaxID=679936 RepID=G8TST4_SULAD|nr:Pirin domain protein [Sulfobacillus acidophilus TPY]AEW04461.1 Pirin domain protein [Sulfobacillus acidophilus DSM 10332]